MIKNLKEKDTHYRAYLKNVEIIDSGKHWDIDYIYYINIANICVAYEEKFNSNLIKDLGKLFNNYYKK